MDSKTNNNTETETNAAGFPLTPCTRCNGTGEFSYCSAYGKTCMQCWGQRFTVAPHAAKAWKAYLAASQQTITFADVKVGDKIKHRKRWITVEAITTVGTITTLTLASGITYGGEADMNIDIKIDTDPAQFLATIGKK